MGSTISWWSPASDGENWTARAATSTFSFSGTQGQVTGTTTANIATLNSNDGLGNPKQWYDSNVIARFQKTAAADVVGLVARFASTNSYYRAEVNNNQLQITKVVSGTATVIGTPFSFTDGGSLFWIRFLCQGFGANGALNNLQAKVWLDGSSEPGSYNVTVSDASLTAVGYVGVRLKGNANGDTQSVDSFTSIDPTTSLATPTYAVTQDAPYGVTAFVPGGNQIISQQLITDLTAWENGVWVRWQAKWSQLETAQSIYQWAPIDELVYRCNQAGIRVCWPIQSPPSWRQTLDAYGVDSTLNATMNSGTGYTTATITALRTGANIPHLAQYSVDWNTGNAETFYIWNPGGTYTSGTTSVGISSSKNSQVAFTPAHTHSVGANFFEATSGGTGGPQYANATDFAAYCALAAARYNGGQWGKLEIIQIGNEEYDSTTRIGANYVSSWDLAGAVLAPVYYACRNSILAVYPGVTVIPCSVRRTPTSSVTHIQNWLTNLISGVLALGGVIDGVDFHYYRGSTYDWNGNLVQDPTLNTYTDSTLAAVNIPSVALEISTIKGVLVANGFSAAQINCWETGWDIYDDAGGVLTMLSAAANSGTAYTSLSVAALPNAVPDETPIYLDYNNTSIAEGGGIPATTTGLYAYGTAAKNALSINITTSPQGSFATQAAFTPTHTHAINAQVYGATTANAVGQAYNSQYIQSMMDAMRTAGCKRCFVYTDNTNATVTTTVYPNSSTDQKSINQTISSTYTPMTAYTNLKNTYIPKYPLWQSSPTVKTVGQITSTGTGGGTSPVIGNDTFVKPNNGSSWGNSTDGQTWNENVGSGTLSISSNEGVIVSTGADTDVQLGGASAADVELLVRFSLNHLLDIAGVQGRYSISNGKPTCYKFLFYSGQCHINKAINGTNTNLTNAGSQIVANTYYWLRFRIQGTNLYGKYWQDGTSEPPAWTTTTTDSSIAGAGGIALLGNTDTGSTGVNFDHFTATNLAGGTGGTGVNTMRLGTKTLADVEAYVRLSVSNVADTAGITLRDQGLTQYYRLQLGATQTQIIAQTPAGGIVTLATYAYTLTANTFYWLKFRVIGINLYGKIWQDGTNEPGGWLLSTTSSAVTGAGQVGLAATLVAVGDVAAFDTFQATAASLNTFVTTVDTFDIMMRAGIAASTGTVTKDVAMRARLVDLSQNAITVTTYAAKRPPLIRKFPKS